MPFTPFGVQQRMSWLIHGGAKKGKSTLAATAPKPVLVIDAEGSWRFIPGRVVYWNDPLSQPPPTYDGTWDICVVHVRQWETLAMVRQYLTQWTLPFVSVVIDSITEIQRRCRANLKGTDQMKIQDWGVLLAIMDDVIRGFRDLTMMPQLAVRCVVFVSESRENNVGRIVPSMQGQIAIALPYWVDVCGMLYVDYGPDGNGQLTKEIRQLYIGPSERFESGERVQGKLGNVLTFNRPPEGQTGYEIAYWMCHAFSIPWERYLASLHQQQGTAV